MRWVLVGLDFDGVRLPFKLSRQPSGVWIEKFRSMGNYPYILGKEPVKLQFRDDEALIPADERDAQQLVGFFRRYVETANRDCREHVEMSRLNWKWRKRSPVKITERTPHETSPQALYPRVYSRPLYRVGGGIRRYSHSAARSAAGGSRLDSTATTVPDSG